MNCDNKSMKKFKDEYYSYEFSFENTNEITRYDKILIKIIHLLTNTEYARTLYVTDLKHNYTLLTYYTMLINCFEHKTNYYYSVDSYKKSIHIETTVILDNLITKTQNFIENVKIPEVRKKICNKNNQELEIKYDKKIEELEIKCNKKMNELEIKYDKKMEELEIKYTTTIIKLNNKIDRISSDIRYVEYINNVNINKLK